ncbi:hypothetical protein AMTR_s00007p00235980, partial [Amborella trichopoda]
TRHSQERSTPSSKAAAKFVDDRFVVFDSSLLYSSSWSFTYGYGHLGSKSMPSNFPSLKEESSNGLAFNDVCDGPLGSRPLLLFDNSNGWNVNKNKTKRKKKNVEESAAPKCVWEWLNNNNGGLLKSSSSSSSSLSEDDHHQAKKSLRIVEFVVLEFHSHSIRNGGLPMRKFSLWLS